MAVQAIGGVSAATSAASTSAKAPAGGTRSGASQDKDSTVVVSTVTQTRPDGSTVTTVTYADGHTKTETTPPKYAAADGDARTTAVNILA